MSPRICWVLFAAATALAQPLPTGWRLQPAGRQIPLEDFPLSTQLLGENLFVLHSGSAPSAAVFDRSGRQVTRLALPDAWLGMSFARDNKLLWVGGGARNSILELAWSGTELKLNRELGSVTGSTLAALDFIGDVVASPDGRLLYAAEMFRDSIAAIHPQSGRVIERFKTGRRPYRIVFHPDGKSFFVTSWAEGSLYQHETANGAEIGRLRLGPGTSDMILSGRKVPDDESRSQFRLFVTASSTNNVFAVGVNANREMKQLEVVNIGTAAAQPAGMTPSALALSADETRVYVTCSDANAVVALDVSEPRTRIAGFIPTGAYPTSARAFADGTLAVANAQSNSLSLIPPPDEATLARHTADVMNTTPYRAEMADEVPAARSVFEHVVYVLTERAVEGPNTAKLAREFVRFDNFQLAGTTSAENHLWSTAALAPMFTRRLMPARAANRLRLANFTGGELANLPPAGYLWSNARAAGLSVRNYGEFVENGRPADASLTGITNLAFQGADDQRASVFLDEWKQLEAAGKLSRLTIVRLNGDDAAVGRIAEGLSKSPAWAKTAVFVAGVAGTAGKSTLFVLSPYTRRGAVDSAAYNAPSVLRTIELILGLKPMTQFDAAARRLTDAFSNRSDPNPFTAVAP